LALNGRADTHQTCPVLKVDRPCPRVAVRSQFDPIRTFGWSREILDFQNQREPIWPG
jgi:hypothetical protein